MYSKVKQYRFLVVFVAIASVVTFAFLRRCKVQDQGVPNKTLKDGPNSFRTAEELGEALFFDSRLSSDNSISCSSCHQPELAFTDGKSKSEGVGGRLSFRNAPSLLNVKDAKTLMFDGHITSLEGQAIVPIQDSNEMNMRMEKLIRKLKSIPEYNVAAKKLFGREFDPWVLTRSLAAYQRTLASENSAFDTYLKTLETKNLGKNAYRGWELFQKFQCVECHQPPHFSDYLVHNNGLTPDLTSDLGSFRIDGDSSKIGSFRTPSLRNVALTAPYLHDGSVTSLETIINRYSEGGFGHVNQDLRIKNRNFTMEEKQFLISFLHSLTDSIYLVNEQ